MLRDDTMAEAVVLQCKKNLPRGEAGFSAVNVAAMLCAIACAFR